MSFYDHTGAALFRVVAASVDGDLALRRHHMACRMQFEQDRCARAKQAAKDQRIVAEREANVTARRIAERVR